MNTARQLFASATLRLTLWYMLILTVLSLLFSVIVFSIASLELHRPLAPRHGTVSIQSDGTLTTLEDIRAAREAESIQRLTSNLIFFNVMTIAAGGFASFFLAKRTLQPIESALEAQTRFTSDAAHELRTPLAVMQSEIEIALRGKNQSVTAQQQVLRSSLDEVQNLRALTDRLLQLASEKSPALSAAKLDEVATDAINRVLTAAAKKRISIQSEVGNESVKANAEMLVDVVVILLDNAIKYSPNKSQVKISTEKQGKYVLLRVKDNGPGIAAEDLPYIFDCFYRADQSRSKTNVEGHGLGLSIARRSVELMQGTIAVSSKIGEGSSFSLRFLEAKSVVD